ncbi:MAG: hypothetical protein KGN38_05070 [Actinomycetales bacterium]|nr:hypothetical protein [Actinomycetales bacterium]
MLRQHGSLCWQCRWWRTHYPMGRCLQCDCESPVGESSTCRLCWEQARLLQEPGRAVDLVAANRHGQQLFLANTLDGKRRGTPRLAPEPRRPAAARFVAAPWRQLVLVDVEPDADLVKARALAADSDLIGHCNQIVAEHAARHGWSKRQRNDVVRSLRLLSVLQDSPGARINATDVLQLPRYDANITSTLDVLAAAGLLIDDRPTRVQTYFASKTGGLPAVMADQLETWLEVMLNGSTTAPRQRSRDPRTAQIHILGIAPIIQAWAVAGHQSLAEITAAQVRAALPATGSHRNWAEYGLRSLFSTLKARKIIFTDPTRGMRSTRVNRTIPLPLDTAQVRDALNAADPVVAVCVALVAFHALTVQQVAGLQLTDIVDHRLRLGERSIPLADPVRARVTAWLDHRQRTWPGSINPHLIVSRLSAPRLIAVSETFPWKKISLSAQALREDRILAEIHASGGDVRRICDLFGISITAALRYDTTATQPSPAVAPQRVRRT